jgi:hypothetical protein
MSDALLERMRANPRADWTIADVERLCRALGLTITAPRLALQGTRSEGRPDLDHSGAPADSADLHQGSR